MTERQILEQHAQQHLVWLRNDLRTQDNPALYEASQQGHVIAVFVITHKQWESHHDSHTKLSLIYQRLKVLQEELGSLGIPLKVIEAKQYSHIPQALLELGKSLSISGLWFNNEYPLNESRRDRAVEKHFVAEGLSVHRFHGDVIFPPGSVLTGQNEMFQVFTPFARRWRQLFRQGFSKHGLSPYPKPKRQKSDILLNNIPHDDIPPFGEPLKESQGRSHEKSHDESYRQSYRDDLWPANSQAIHRKLTAFAQKRLERYGEDRDMPSLPGTSTLSPYLTIGALGIRECLAAAEKSAAKQPGSNTTLLDEWLDCTWVTELIWREFYRHIMAAHPKISWGKCFRPAGDNVRWDDNEKAFQAWCEGNTGFPIVDAGMRQLKQTGWMHNRVRMITAAFLAKLTLVDWHKGEAFFMQHLIDGDFASNNGGWQWSASVGADAAPYFRIFNPYRQAERFDPEGEYVRRFVPELQSLPAKQIHKPSLEQCRQLGYPDPIIDYSQARKRALAVLEAAFKHGQ
ncbi:cryptochrome/photolyase family protein [Marinibactrum halimedae]|uniref:Deoxyribodipyrimidine photo-lyase n=1 Tax=Marinibactrum halimedae TaxID=1444977 RepID=A0AA37T4E4_9GAMM|nr:FAD-binding domain-containing protein [Marinibactrum halimedae]MCD9457713.1 deoxyribodipyrimidine photo-lyase [Marinibactrum halimedae]GLS24913.1 deoxyribodipyrimidine photo-lyase [Marinibactrum halimedae]